MIAMTCQNNESCLCPVGLNFELESIMSMFMSMSNDLLEYEYVATRLTRHTVLIFLPDPERSLGTSIFAPNVKAEGDASETSRHAHTHGCHCCLFLQTSCPCLFPLLWLIQDKRNRLCVVDHSSGPIFFNCVGDHAKAHFPYVFHFVDQLLQSDHLEFMPCRTVKKK